MPTIKNKIVIETIETIVIKKQRRFLRSWCSQCNKEVGMVLLHDACLLSGTDIHTIYLFIQLGYFHIRYLDNGQGYICINSLCHG